MYIYFLVSTIALTTVLYPSRKYVAFALLVLAVICGVRDGVLGYDFIVYQNYFDNLMSDGNVYNYEIGYYWLNYFFNIGDFSFHDFLFLISFLYHFCLFILLFYLEDEIGMNPGWVLFFYVTSGSYFWHSYTLLRQSFAICIFYLSITMSLSRALAFNFIGPFFHVSSIINILVIASLKIRAKITLKNIVIISIFFIFLGIVLADVFKEKFEVYEFDNTANVLVLSETLIQSLLLLFLMKESKFSSLVNVVILVSISFCILGFFVNAIFIRFLEPYKIIMFMAYAVFLLRIRQENKKLYIGTSILLIVLSYLRLYRFFDTFGDYAVPYMSILN